MRTVNTIQTGSLGIGSFDKTHALVVQIHIKMVPMSVIPGRRSIRQVKDMG